MYKQYTAVVLAVLVAAAEANTVAFKDKPILQLLKDVRSWEGLGLSANVNDYVDNTISMLTPFIQEHGLDPMPLPDVAEGFEVRPLLITYSAWLRIHDGEMRGLVNVARSGDQNVYYFGKMLRLRLQLQFTDLEIFYNYLVQVMNIGPTGRILATLSRFIVTIDLLIDFNNDEIQLQEFSLTDVGRLRVRLGGNILIDWLVTPIINVFISIFDNIIINVIVSNIRSALQVGISVINANIQEILRALESLN